jgi:hypothetical protein
MAYESVRNPVFQSTVARWIAETHEVLVMIRFSAAAGSRSFEFFDAFDAFRDRLDQLPLRACVTAFRDQQLSLRGRVDAEFINQAISSIPGRTEYLLVDLELTTIGKASWYRYAAGENHEELREDLEDHSDCLVALGPYPRWFEDNESVISAVVPDPDGSVHTGIY